MELEKMDTMYVKKVGRTLMMVTDGAELPIEVNKVYGNENAKFIFSQVSGGFEVRSEYKNRLIYRKPLLKDITYVITSLYVDTVNPMDGRYQELYTYLVENKYKFKLMKTEDNTPYEMYVSMWVDVTFGYTLEVYVNTDILSDSDLTDMKTLLKACDVNTFNEIFNEININGENFMIRLTDETINLFNMDSLKSALRERRDV